MKPADLLALAIAPALDILPSKMLSGHRILTAIAFQESGLRHRYQQDGDSDPYDDAVGWWQFEQVGVDGVEHHPATAQYAAEVRLRLSIERDEVHRAMRYNDVLAAAYARLLLWRHPDPLPDDEEGAWNYYLSLWRPGKPHKKRWAASWRVR